MALELREFSGAALEPHLDALGALRIAVFREFPYLYEGTLEYERAYLHTYAACPRSLVVLAIDNGSVVGATTCLPMADAEPEFQSAFRSAGYNLDAICYFGESILLPAFRGQGVGREFFRRRESHAVRLGGIRLTAFCAVNRPEDHPRRPPGHRPLDAFWRGMGYVRHSELQAAFEWKESGEDAATAKTLTFWLKTWT